jgi:phage FluMu protein gp41
LGLLPWLSLFSRFGNPLGGAFTANPFQQFGAVNEDNSGSSASTTELSMTLDHESGTIEGEVLNGPYSNRTLRSLSDSEVAELYHSLQEEESRRLLESYVERHRPNMGESEQSAENQQPTNESQMSIQRAADILGVDADAPRDEIVGAHRRLIQHLHPDRGGSSYLAAEINEARRILLDNL